jgi:hypothetical protein
MWMDTGKGCWRDLEEGIYVVKGDDGGTNLHHHDGFEIAFELDGSEDPRIVQPQ